ncbi:Antitoxin YefM [termite gut metagenome]|uniref:Antitoxin YefM n=1 Tax=termite gut metagenome TaxID=433724 RepID=A0A5J4RWX3_9ZZZZ
MRTTNYTDLRKNLKTFLDGVTQDSEALLVQRPGNTSVVVIPLDEYNAIKETEYILSSPAMVERIHSAEENLRQGKGIELNLSEL